MKCPSCSAVLPDPAPERCPACGASAAGVGDAALDSILGRIDSPDATIPAGSLQGLAIPPRRKAGKPSSPVRRRRKSVIVIDDDEDARRAVVALLSDAQIPVRDAGDGRQGLSLIATLSPDVVVVDPDLSGAVAGSVVLERLRARAEFAAIPTVLYTRTESGSDEGERGDLRVAKSAGPTAVLQQVIRLFRGP